MGAVFALLVGIDEYQAVRPLSGAVRDVELASEYLKARVTGELHELVLLDGDATRDAIVEGFRHHLRRAGPGDVALFWFSGHGSQQPVQPAFRLLEAESGLNQTLVCVDSRVRRKPDLADKELRVLLDDVAARGAHTVAILDCCHSGGATRDLTVGIRGVGTAREAPAAEAFIEELRHREATRDVAGGTDGGGAPQHLTLAACRASELAKELPLDGAVRGVFSWSLLAGLQTLGAGATYRDLLVAARCKVENSADDQIPLVIPADPDGIADRPFLGGTVRRTAASFVLRNLRGSWEVDAGSTHGIPAPDDGASGPIEFAVAQGADRGAGQRARVTDVHPERSLVVPLDWTPDPGQVYPVVLSTVPLPPAAVVVGGLDGDDDAALKLVHDAVATAGPGGGPSPHVRVVAPTDTSAAGLRLRVSTIPPEEGAGPLYRILRADTSPATADLPGHTAESAGIVVSHLEHIARWSHIKNLTNPASGLADAMSIQVVLAAPGEQIAPADRPALVPDENGEVRIAYRQTVTGFEPPQIFVRLHNHSDRRLWCVVLDLTDRYRVHPKLFAGDFIGPGRTGVALEGKPIKASLPQDRAVRPGALVRDWFKLIFADEQFGATAFDLPRLGEPPARSVLTGRQGFVGRLGLSITRDLGDEDEDAPPSDWSTVILPLVTVVPGAQGER
ncbi:MAG: caspase family protein [Acidimicrobiales bacterium]